MVGEARGWGWLVGHDILIVDYFHFGHLDIESDNKTNTLPDYFWPSHSCVTQQSGGCCGGGGG